MNSVLSNVGRWVLAGSLVWVVGCGENTVMVPSGIVLPNTEFPDSVTRSMGPPPSAVLPSSGGTPLDTHASGDFSGLVAHATSEITDAGPRMLRATMWVVNPGTDAVTVEHDICGPGVLLSSPGRSAPVWQSGHARDPRLGPTVVVVCPAVAQVRTIAPGDSIRFAAAYPMYEIVGDSLPATTYDVRVLQNIAPLNFAGGITERTFDAPGGRFTTTRAADPLPLTRVTDTLTYVATTRRTRDSTGNDVFRALVLVTNRTASKQYAWYFGSCPITLDAYRSRADRDSVPSIPAVATLTGGCNDNNQHTFALDPGQSWVFGTDIPVASLNGRYRAGQYWFTATFGNVRLSANQVDTR